MKSSPAQPPKKTFASTLRGCFVLPLFVVSVSMAANWSYGKPPEFAAEIDRLVQPYLDNSVIAGMVVGAIRGDETLVRGYGREDLDRPAKPDGKTIYEIGSISKTFTGLLLADAVVDGRVQLDQPVAEVVPDQVEFPQHADGPILLKHLATHVSGLPRMPSNMKPKEPQDPYADYGADGLYAFLSSHSLERGPEQKAEYSNLAFGLLGQILAEQSNTSYGELVEARIAEPLKMKDTTAEVDEVKPSRLAVPYDANLERSSNWRFQSIAGAGAVCSTADDMLRYARAHLNPPRGPLGEAIELAWKTQQPPLAEGDFAVGLGWHIARDGETRWHNGQTGGYHSMIMIHRPSKTAVVLLANTATMEADRLAEQLMRMLLGIPEQPRQFEKSVEVAPEQMQRLVGRYQLTPEFILTVQVEEGKLMVGATGQPFFRVFPQSDTEWKYGVVDASLTFETGDEGPATAVVLHQGGIDQRATRMPEPEAGGDDGADEDDAASGKQK
ncbi:serine hydrolase [Candidatus Laterigemmans baculatus]|uniref:serine hydrolase n=1 Tax=Candidatus Laterigemmans baculatus TaxID=2770505 RepID=UPI0013DAA780|nr:serine hydrolase [Candidatus Laterigemmans baculatus]